MNMKSFLLACGILTTGMLSAATATLNVDLTVTHGVCSDSEGAESRKVVFLVIDRSGSMGEATLSGGRTPNEALVESLKLQLAAIPRGTEVHVIPFSSTIWEEQTYKCFDDKGRKAILDFVKKEAPKGQTVLYDAEDLALSAAAKVMDRDANAEVRVLVYTDGEHLTPWNYEGEYKACYQNRTNGVGRKRFENNPDYRSDLEGAKKKFKTRFAGLISRPNLEVEYEWLSETDKPEADMVTKTQLPTELKSQTAGLANPLANPEQTVKGALHLPISDKCWEEVKGKPISLDFEVGGKHVTEVIKLEPGQHSCKLAWPALPTDEPATAKISLSRLPGGTKFELKEPKPLQWNVPAQGRVSVEVTSPSKGAVVALNSKVSFMAKASDHADVKWSVGPAKESLKGLSANWTANVAGMVSYSVTASRDGFKPATASGTLEVIETGVKVTCGDDRHEINKESVFQAKAVGPCLRYVWTIDGHRVSGEEATLRYRFEDERPGEHRVGVTAFYKNNLQSEPAEKTISVAMAPRVRILKPAPCDGDVENVTLQAEKPFDLEAVVEGGLTEVRWQFKLKDKTVSIPTEVKDGKTVGSCVLPKGGYYDVVATGKGPAGEKASEPIQIFVKSAEVHVDIRKPKPNAEVKTGEEVELEADVKGPVKCVRWKMTDRSTAKTISFGVSDEAPVINGTATMKAKLPLELGNRSVTVEAEPVLADQDLADTVAPSVIVINAKTDAGIDYTSETRALNGKNVKYGEQVTLAVTISGAIDAESVEWVSVGADGRSSKLMRGLSINVTQDLIKGRRQYPIGYRARGKMPDGNWRETPIITIAWYCPHIEPKIVLPNNEADFAIDEEVLFKVISGNRERGELTDDDVEVIRWNFGDGTVVANNHVTMKHAFKKITDAVTVSVQTVCKRCGEEEPPSATQAVSIARPVFCSCVAAEILMPGTNSVIYLGERTEFRLRNSRSKVELSDNDFKSVDWVIQDGSCEAKESGTDIGHEFSCIGAAKISAKMVCKHCGRSSAASISRPVTNRPISVALGFNPDDNVFRPGTSVKLMDKSLGRVKGRKWFVDGVAVQDDGKEVSYRLPRMPSEYSVNLAVCDSEGLDFLRGITNIVQLDEIAAKGYLDKDKEELVRGVYYHPGHLREMKARWGQIAAWIILAVAALVWFGIWKVFHGNEPRGWNVQVAFCTEEDALRTEPKRLHRIAGNGMYVDLKGAWSRWRKHALVKVRDIAEGAGKKAADWVRLPDDCLLKFKQSASAKQAYVEFGSRYLSPVNRELPKDMKGRAFLYRKIFGKTGDVQYMLVSVDGVKPSVAMNFFLYIILPLLLLGLSYYLMTIVAF